MNYENCVKIIEILFSFFKKENIRTFSFKQNVSDLLVKFYSLNL